MKSCLLGKIFVDLIPWVLSANKLLLRPIISNKFEISHTNFFILEIKEHQNKEMNTAADIDV